MLTARPCTDKLVFHSAEQSVQILERSKHLTLRIDNISAGLRDGLSNKFVRFSSVQNYLDLAKKLLEWQASLIRLPGPESKLIEKNLTMRYYISKISLAVTLIEQAVLQRSVLRGPEQKFLKQRSISGIDVSDIYKTIDKLYAFFIRLYFGPKHRANHFCVTGLNNEFSSYTVEPVGAIGTRIDVIFVPTVDVARSRLWSSIAHEAAHHRLNMIREVVQKKGLQSFEKESDRLADDISELLGRKRYKNLPPKDRQLISQQVEEIFCDFCSTVAVGPASPLTLACYSLPTNGWVKLSESDVEGKVVAKKTFTDHPPMPSRMRYMFQILESYRNTKTLNADLKALRDWWSTTEGNLEMCHDFSDHPTKYVQIVESHFEAIMDFVQSDLIAGSRDQLFNSKKWDIANNLASNIQKKIHGVDVVTVLNVPWLRRIKAFQRLDLQREITISQIENEETFTREVVLLINRLL